MRHASAWSLASIACARVSIVRQVHPVDLIEVADAILHPADGVPERRVDDERNGGQQHEGEHVRLPGLHQHHEQGGDGGAAEVGQPEAEEVLAPDRAPRRRRCSKAMATARSRPVFRTKNMRRPRSVSGPTRWPGRQPRRAPSGRRRRQAGKTSWAATHMASGGAVALNSTRRAGMGRRARRIEMTRPSIATVTGAGRRAEEQRGRHGEAVGDGEADRRARQPQRRRSAQRREGEPGRTSARRPGRLARLPERGDA